MNTDFNYSSVASLIQAAEKNNLPVSALVLSQQAQQIELDEKTVYEKMASNFQVMKECIEPGCDEHLKSTSGLTGGDAFKLRRYSESGKSLTGSFLSGALYRALAVSELNASMGRIVAAPTAGSCGILPAALITMQEEKGCSDHDCVMALFTASAVGMVIANNASLAGAQGGCQAECGSAAAMAAAAITEMLGGTPSQAFDAAAIAIQNIMGLVCDPVAGLVEMPCAKRNASGVANALVSADLALSGIFSEIPFDEVVEAMYKVGKALPSTLRETALGGVATTPTALAMKEKIYGKGDVGCCGDCASCGGC